MSGTALVEVVHRRNTGRYLLESKTIDINDERDQCLLRI